MTTGGSCAKTTTNKKVRVFIQSKNIIKEYCSMSEAARELSKEFSPLTFTQEYISKICHGEVYSYYKDFFLILQMIITILFLQIILKKIIYRD